MLKEKSTTLKIAMIIAFSTFIIHFNVPAAFTKTTTVDMEGPSAAYCLNQGGNFLIRKDSKGNDIGICSFNDGSECDEAKFFRKECAKGNHIPNKAKSK
jgi:putative hemolysin